MNLRELIDKKIEEKIDAMVGEALSSAIEEGRLGENSPAPFKSARDEYIEELDLLKSRPDITRETLEKDEAWLKFKEQRPGPKLEVVYRDYTLQKDYLALKEKLSAASAKIESLEAENAKLAGEIGSLTAQLAPKAEPERKGGKPIRKNLKDFLKSQKLTQTQMAELLGLGEGSSLKVRGQMVSDVIHFRSKGTKGFWQKLQKEFELTDEQIAELKEGD